MEVLAGDKQDMHRLVMVVGKFVERFVGTIKFENVLDSGEPCVPSLSH